MCITVAMANPRAEARPVALLPEQCGLYYSSLFAHFERPVPDKAIVRFKDEKKAWVQWLDIDRAGSDGSSLSVDTRFLGPQDTRDHRSSVICSLEDASQSRNPWNLQNPACPDVALVVDNGPEVDVREAYFDGSNLRVVFEVIERKWFAAGIALLNERVALSVDGKVVRTIPVQGLEPQMVVADLKLAPGRRYAVLYGVLANGGDHKGKLDPPNGVICV